MGQACCSAHLPISGHWPSPPSSGLPGGVAFEGLAWTMTSPQGGAWVGNQGSSAFTCLSSLQFADGVYLVLLMGLLEGYFVPLHSFFLTPDSFEQKVRGGDVKGGPSPLAPIHLPTLMLGSSGKKRAASYLSVQGLQWLDEGPILMSSGARKELTADYGSSWPWFPSHMFLPGAIALPYLSLGVTGKVVAGLVRPEDTHST